MASKSHSFPIYALIVLLVEAALCLAAATSPITYWNSMLPKTPMPSALLPFFLDATDVKKPFLLSKEKHGGLVGHRDYMSSAKPLSHEDMNAIDFVREKDLQTGAEFDLHFYDTSTGEGGFLHRDAAKSIPFSSNKLPEILRRFSIKSNTAEAKAMKDTIEDCELPEQAGEKKLCSTSLESMVDFVTSTFGTHDVKAMSTTVMMNKGLMSKSSNLKQKYIISSPGAKEVKATKYIICHPTSYPYAVFYCHKFDAVTTYSVPLVGNDGTKLNALVNCHLDTSAWNPNHVSFRVLKVKPGTTPVCHFLSQDNVVWTTNGDIKMVVSSE